jgi:hypothetical protein
MIEGREHEIHIVAPTINAGVIARGDAIACRKYAITQDRLAASYANVTRRHYANRTPSPELRQPFCALR